MFGSPWCRDETTLLKDEIRNFHNSYKVPNLMIDFLKSKELNEGKIRKNIRYLSCK
jgi:hypothetical protein